MTSHKKGFKVLNINLPLYVWFGFLQSFVVCCLSCWFCWQWQGSVHPLHWLTQICFSRQSRSRDAFTQCAPDIAVFRSAVHKQRHWQRASNICMHFSAFFLATLLCTAPESGLRHFVMPTKSYVLGNLTEQGATYISSKWNKKQVPQTEKKPSVLVPQANERPSLKL